MARFNEYEGNIYESVGMGVDAENIHETSQFYEFVDEYLDGFGSPTIPVDMGGNLTEFFSKTLVREDGLMLVPGHAIDASLQGLDALPFRVSTAHDKDNFLGFAGYEKNPVLPQAWTKQYIDQGYVILISPSEMDNNFEVAIMKNPEYIYVLANEVSGVYGIVDGPVSIINAAKAIAKSGIKPSEPTKPAYKTCESGFIYNPLEGKCVVIPGISPGVPPQSQSDVAKQTCINSGGSWNKQVINGKDTGAYICMYPPGKLPEKKTTKDQCEKAGYFWDGKSCIATGEGKKEDKKIEIPKWAYYVGAGAAFLGLVYILKD